MLAIDMDAIDRLVENYLKSPVQPQPPKLPSTPQRIDRVVHLQIPEEVQLLKIQARWQEAIARAQTDDERIAATRRARIERAGLRLSVITPVAQGDVGSITYVYGGQLSGAMPLRQSSGECLECDTLIHLTHPCSPEDLLLREKNIKARRIYRYRVPKLDDAEWEAQEQPLRWPPTAQEYRDLLVLRNLQMRKAHQKWF